VKEGAEIELIVQFKGFDFELGKYE